MKKLVIAAILATASMGATAASATQYWVEHGVKLNARSGPGTHYHVLGTFNPCTPVHVYAHKHGWAKVKFNGYWYWVSAKYLQKHACHYHAPKKKHHHSWGY
ncbi:SH3 domain-containing protein [Pseudoponticoccus marisrubri]|uniref:SH3b domain-containing protein n=1 Tax=Pseudoponticoccus marisrubri TaxID=1685382 RepID=A0A0W7WM47_9RHOB|nr:SH3 domain-containing protein [Pseudoponticoccus marisrubri]KUF11576.1 hypothetical protein AVJ23_07410 [Pseudoponticoccus marisrubri]